MSAGAQPATAAGAGAPGPDSPAYPLTPAQLASWLGRLPAFALPAPCPGTYLEVDVEALDLARYRDACRALVDRHDALRLRVRPDGTQYALPPGRDVELAVEDLRDVDEPAREARLADVRRQMLRSPADPVRDPPFEVRACALDGARTRLHVRLDELAADPDSVELLGADLAALYRGEPLPELGIGYLDVVARAGDGLDGAELDPHRRYWQARLGAAAPAPQPPMVADPGALADPCWSAREARLAGPVWQRLRERAASAGLTPDAVLHAAFGQALGGWCKEPRFSILAQRGARPAVHPDVRWLAGCFTAVAPCAVDSDPRRPLRERAEEARLRDAADRGHSGMSGPDVADELRRMLGQPPTAAVLPVRYSCRLTGEPADADRARSAPADPSGSAPAGLAAWALGTGRVAYSVYQAPQTWLRHDATDHSGELLLRYDTVDALFPAGLVDDLVAYHTDLLARLAADPAAWAELGAECLPARQAEVRARVNATEVALPDVLLHEPFWAQARRTPDAPAVIAVDRTLTYRELRTGAAALGDRLRALGAVPNQMVAVVMEKGWEQVLAVYGILESGAAYVPIEPDLPQERFHYLLGHCEATVALVQPHLLDALPWPAGVRPLVVDAGLLDGPDRTEPSRLQGQRDLAYVIYTSGSTGLPKGVMIDHRGPLNTVLDINRRFAVGPDDRMLALTPLSFDLSVYDLFGPLGVGGALVMPEAGSGRAPWHWAELVERHGVTLWNTVPALMEMLVGYTLGRRERLGATLRLVMMSGDWIPVSLPDRIRALGAPGIELVSLGGATEASIWSIYHRIEAVRPDWVSIPYGTPLANQHFEILDESLRRRPDWVPGEQYVGGFGVAMGYWHDPDKTRRSFIIHPRTGQRLYRTGDLGRYFPDGSIEFLGREDFQVKIHGYRIELGEIEAALAAHERVSAALVTALGAARGEKRLVAYVTAGEPTGEEPGSGSDADALTRTLRDHLSARLPAYMVPSHIIVLDAFPLTRNGKIDRKALPSPVNRPASAAGSGGPTPDGTQARLLAIWRELTGAPTLGPDDENIAVDVGAAQLVRARQRIHRDLGVELPLDAVFAAPTVRALAEAVTNATSAGNG